MSAYKNRESSGAGWVKTTPYSIFFLKGSPSFFALGGGLDA